MAVPSERAVPNGDAAITIPQPSDEVGDALVGNFWPFEDAGLGRDAAEGDQVLAHVRAPDVEGVGRVSFESVNTGLCPDEPGHLLKQVLVHGVQLAGLSIGAVPSNAAIREHQSKHPRHLGRPGAEEGPVTVVAPLRAGQMICNSERPGRYAVLTHPVENVGWGSSNSAADLSERKLLVMVHTLKQFLGNGSLAPCHSVSLSPA